MTLQLLHKQQSHSTCVVSDQQDVTHDAHSSESLDFRETFKREESGHKIIEKALTNIINEANVTNPKEETAAAEKHACKGIGMLAKILILRHIASKNIGVEIPTFDTEIPSFEICRSLGIDDKLRGGRFNVNESERMQLDITIQRDAIYLGAITSIIAGSTLHNERNIGIKATTSTIFLSSTDDRDAHNKDRNMGSCIPKFEDTATSSEVGHKLGIDEYLESSNDDYAQTVFPTSFTNENATII
ncbi:hypothetical protein CANMA_003681 [Candida margitis]|uniref:uncharacterized protein n=1 Tax=Candida margitis TaxID=1775924 RepID=UPI002226C60F|nr:uncharacterized protein CANMA_003681 [Candida margitis]KAI5962029.1 hypothetical protein CANMA_003681 [Candida margitis]